MKMNYKFRHFGFLAILIVAGWTACATAMESEPITSFDSTWQTVPQGCNAPAITTDAATINMQTQGSETGCSGIFYKTGTNGVTGMWATLQVDEIGGFGRIGIQGSFGLIGNSKIQAQLFLEQYENHKSIRYNIKSIDLYTGSCLYLSIGTIGSWENSWVPGDQINVAFAIVENEIWIYADAYPQLMKLQMLDEITPYNDFGYPAAFFWTDAGSENSISGSVSDIFLIYP